jgi:flagellin-like protein
MGKKNLLKDRRGISPVITTVILVAVGIAIAVAIALWMSGLVGLFTRFEKIEIKNAYVEVNGANFEVNVVFSNTGSSDTSIDALLLNGKPCSSWGSTTFNGTLPIAAPVGVQKLIVVTIPSGAKSGDATLTSGVTVTITLHSTGGKEYPASVALP